MKSWVLAAGLLAVTAGSGAQAADLDEIGPPDRRGSAYDDPRYADIYRYPDRPPPPAFAGPPPRAYSYREEEYETYPGARRFSYSDPRSPYAQHCVPREEIKHRLASEGWHDFHAAELQGNVATVHARRPSGRLFQLAVDRCSGEIVNARPLEAPAYGPFAYGPPPRRWARPY